MHFGDTLRIAAPRPQVWEFLLDPHRVAACGPGVESVEVVDDRHFRAVVKVGIGQFRARFNVNLELADLTPIERASIRGSAQAPGTAVDGTARMELREAGDGSTEMTWEADVQVRGRLAAVGTRLIDLTANRLIAQAVDCVRSQLENGES